jgi:carbon storage regulator
LSTEEKLMLVLTRKTGEAVVIDGTTILRVLEIKTGRVRIGIDAPPDVRVDRAEVFRQRAEFAEIDQQVGVPD